MNQGIIAYRELVHPDKVHGSLYTDPEIFAEEMAKIFYSTWVFVGHSSEIPQPGDYVVKSVGPQPVIMSRGRDGQVHLMQNRCAHRGNLVCAGPKGNASAFRCSYHGWTYNNDGSLLGFPYKRGYDGVLDKSEISLGKLRTASYQGFVFGTFAQDGPTLLEHLGNATDCLDRLVSLAPGGEVVLSAGWLKHKVKANWKMMLENETDGYHPQFVHASIFEVSKSGIGGLYSEKSTAVCRDLGNGHTENDLRPEFRKAGVEMGWFGATAEKVPGYVQAMRDAHGEDRAREIMIDGSPHVMIFPNLFVAEIQLFVIQPLAVDLTVQHVTCVQFKGGADLNRRLLQQTIGSVGPAGFLLADDSELYERTQRGVAVRSPEWALLSRGLKREYLEDGRMVSNNTDETTLRAIWRHYLDLMEA